MRTVGIPHHAHVIEQDNSFVEQPDAKFIPPR
jgi:hypothetical protein